MASWRPNIGLILNETGRIELSPMVRSQSLPAGITTRAKIVLR